jgi:hypothetical protein
LIHEAGIFLLASVDTVSVIIGASAVATVVVTAAALVVALRGVRDELWR